MKKRRRPPRDAAVFPSAPTLVISPSEILRRKTIAANWGPGKLPFRRDAFTDFLCAACGSHSALREKADEARGTRADYENNCHVSTASIFRRRRTLAAVTGANRG